MFHPWRRLRGKPEINVTWPVMPDRLGSTNGTTVIRMHPHQSQVQRRCTLAHELAHIELGHINGCSPAEDRVAEQYAARWLIEMDDLLDALRWAEDMREVADCLWVDEPTLMARLDGLTAAEKNAIVNLHKELDRPC
ncbi:hypothetical protein Cde04nite_33800 [Cellulomonas denverensis]|nr:hypothetical protein Cde04nite_33800 [Cellulomonas denverensis]